MAQQSNLFTEPYIDITANRHRNSPTSREANKQVAPRKADDRQRILDLMKSRNGMTWLKSVVRQLDMPVQTASARLSELKATGQIEVVANGARIDGCAVVRLTK
jgi:predicted Rossmann fold nucleotide-binding protein DprA/Smf involved in DNA uptake